MFFFLILDILMKLLINFAEKKIKNLPKELDILEHYYFSKNDKYGKNKKSK